MQPDDARREIDATLRAQGYQATSGTCATYQGPISVHGRRVDVRIEIPDVRFVERPRIFLADRSQIDLDILAHVETESSICYASAAGLPLDSYQPGAGILRVLKEAESTLERSYKGQGVEEVADEYQQYWKGRAVRSLLARSHINPIQDASIRSAIRDEHKIWVLTDATELSGWTFDTSAMSARVFSTSGRIGPASSATSPETFPSLQEWWCAQSSLSQFRWRDVAAALFEAKVCFVFAANACVGFSIVKPSDIAAGLRLNKMRASSVPAMLARRSENLSVERWNATDCSLERITSRNAGANIGLSHLKIALVGCGTIGSHLARMLVQSGAGAKEHFFLFDNDVISLGNLGRHLLNFGDLGEGKAEALSRELERFHPDVSLTPLADNAVKRWPMLKECDIIVDATGDWNVQNALNQLFLEDKGDRLTAIAHSWVFANGVGAQSFINLGDDKACFRCLRPAFDGQWRFPAAANGIETEFTPATCGDGTFAAFSVDAPVIAAALTNRAILDWARGQPGPLLRTVAVDMTDGRYQPPKTPEPSAQCPACAHLRPKK
jgi:molybdopterin/thiamine biosynthesis adenylyltransferase